VGGIGILSNDNAFKGNIIVTTDLGSVIMIDAATGAQTLIASGGTEGGFMAPDPTNGSLLLSQSREVFRLDCGSGCGTGSAGPPAGTPEPASILAVGAGLIVAFVLRRTKGRAGIWIVPLAYCVLPTKPAVAQSAQPVYAITDLGTLTALGDTDSNAFAISSSGTVVGVSGTFVASVQGISPSHAYAWIPTSPNAPIGTIRDLGGLPGFICGTQRFDTVAGSINDANQIVGSSFTSNGDCFLTGATHAALWNLGGETVDLVGLAPGGSNAATGINIARTVVGISLLGVGSSVWLYDVIIHDLGALPGFSISQSAAINARGQIAGWGNRSDFSTGRAFLHAGTGPIAASDDIGTLGGPDATANGINDDGSVVGNSDLSNGVVHAYLYANGRMTDLGSLTGPSGNSGASAINSAGDIVGGSDAGGAGFHAVLWKNGAIVDLNTLIDPNLGWLLTFANGINTFGQIVGQGVIGGQRHAFLLTPTTGLVSFTLQSSTICGTAQTTGTVTLASPAPGGGTAVTILSAHPSIADGPAIVTVPSGQTTASFPITSHQVTDAAVVNFQVLLNGQTLSANLTVSPLLSAVDFAPAKICGLGKTTATVRLACPAPADETIRLTTTEPDFAPVPGNIVIPKASAAGAFSITGGNASIDADATITATLDAETKSGNLTVQPLLGNLAINPATVAGGSAATGTVSLTIGQACAAPVGGLNVALVSDDVDVAQPDVPTITIAAGAQIGTFRIMTTVPTKASCTENPPSSDGSCTVNIAAHAAGSTQTASIKVTPQGSPAVDVSQLVSVVAGGFRFDRTTGLYLQQVMVVNQSLSLQSIPGPISLVLNYFHPNDMDPDSWALAGATDAGSGQTLQTGKTTVSPLGRPYVRLSLDRLPAPGVFNPGDVLTINLSYTNPGNTAITWVPVVLQGF
jgi:probable HAF family extracellular repeat protein